MKKTKWAVIAPGRIAEKFAAGLVKVDSAVSYAVASRNIERAKTFAQKWGFEKSYGSYAELFADSAVDAVYIASPNMNHHELSIQALQNGKHVLCEKPATLNAKMLQSVLDAAKKNKRFYMEALWTKFLPSYLWAIETVKSGKIGELQSIIGNFFLNRPYVKDDRRYELSLGGGALIDIGIYPIIFALGFTQAYGANLKNISGIPRISTDGIDIGETIAMQFEKKGFNPAIHESAQIFANFSCALDTECVPTLNDGYVIGSKGKIRLPSFWMATQAELYDVNANLLEKKEFPFRGNGFEYEIEEATRCIQEGLLESALHTHAQTLICIQTLDNLRSQWNLKYPNE